MEKRKHYSRLGTLPKARFWHGREAEFNNKSMHYKQEKKKKKALKTNNTPPPKHRHLTIQIQERNAQQSSQKIHLVIQTTFFFNVYEWNVKM